MFFSFDGIDGAGKSTQIQHFRFWLEQHDRPTMLCRDPGTTRLGEKIRELLLEHSDLAIDLRTEMLLYMASRAQLVSERIRPALDRNEWVVCDRFLIANIAYQGFGGGLDPAEVETTGRIAIDGTHPDLTFILDIDYHTAQTRLGRQPDRVESRGAEFFERVREGFLTHARKDPDRFVVIDATRPPEVVQQQVRDRATTELQRRGLALTPQQKPDA